MVWQLKDRDKIVDVITDEVVTEESEVLSPETARRIEEMGYERIRVRSPLTCEAPLGVCSLCYGMDLSRGKVVERGMTLVPVRMYFKRGRVKVAVSLAKGKREYDKRETVRQRDADREARSAIKDL